MFEFIQTSKLFHISEMTKAFYVSKKIRSSYKEHRVNALALGAEEGRSKLR